MQNTTQHAPERTGIPIAPSLGASLSNDPALRRRQTVDRRVVRISAFAVGLGVVPPASRACCSR